MKLITELSQDVEYITEATEAGGKNFYIKGTFMQAALQNKNGRVYPESVMDREVGRYLTEKVNNNCAYGELGHPSGPSINLDRVSHIITELKKDGTNWIGKARITDTPMGNTAKGIMQSGGRLGVSTRGMGTVQLNKEGVNVVQDDFRLATAADIVADPSAPDAWVAGIMESCEWFYDEKHGWKMVNLVEQAKVEINAAIASRQLGERKLKIFENYLNNISKVTF